MDRTWYSGIGGLYFTIVLRPELSPNRLPLINLAAAVDLAAVLNQSYTIPAEVKWPNDIMVNDRKIAGILSQMQADADRVIFVNIGIGVNVNNVIDPVETPTTSMKRILGREVSRAELLQSFLDKFESRMGGGRLDGVVSEWKRMTCTLGKHVSIKTLDQSIEGLAVDIEENGGLILKMSDGATQTVVFGDCFHQSS
jgi:BirA family biotin operon repressor/biotin-[acetyl-CoA-carboxylase] ligase